MTEQFWMVVIDAVPEALVAIPAFLAALKAWRWSKKTYRVSDGRLTAVEEKYELAKKRIDDLERLLAAATGGRRKL